VQRALLVAAVDGLVEGRVDALLPGLLGRVEADRGGDLNGGVEKQQALDEARFDRGDLERDAGAERVPEPDRRLCEPSVAYGGGDVLDVLLEVPRGLPARVAVPTEVGRDHVEAAGQPLRQPREVPAVARHAVQADERRCARLAPLVEGDHPDNYPDPAPSGPETSSVRRVSASATRLQTIRPDLSIRNVPRTGVPRVSSKTP
jgi:hypothetical protein